MLGGPGLLVIAGIALAVFGPKKLAELVKTFGGLVGEFKKTTEEMKRSIGIDELQEIRTSLTGMDLLTEMAEKVAASMSPEEVTEETPVTEQVSARQSSIPPAAVEKVEMGKDDR